MRIIKSPRTIRKHIPTPPQRDVGWIEALLTKATALIVTLLTVAMFVPTALAFDTAGTDSTTAIETVTATGETEASGEAETTTNEAKTNNETETEITNGTEATGDGTSETETATTGDSTGTLDDTQPADVTVSNTALTNAANDVTSTLTFSGESGAETLKDIIGDARYFGIVTNTWQMAEAETNAAAKHILANGQSGNDMTNQWDQPWVVGQITGDLKIKGYSGNKAQVWHRPGDEQRIVNITLGFAGVKVVSHPTEQSVLDAYVDTLINHVRSTSSALAAKSSMTEGEVLPQPNTDGKPQDKMTTNYVLDFTGKPDNATYYVNLDSIYSQLNEGGLRIEKHDNQTIVFNLTGSTINLKQFRVNDTDSASANMNADSRNVAQTIVWNMPNATTVDTTGGVTGMFLAPNATFNLNNTSAGWLIADRVNSGAGEWHHTYPGMDDDYPKPSVPARIGMNATKTLSANGAVTHADIDDFNGLFQFKVVATGTPEGVTAPMPSNANENGIVTNANDVIDFGSIEFETAGTYTYEITEITTDPAAGITPDGHHYFATYVVEADAKGALSVTSSTFEKADSAGGARTGADAIAFTNDYKPTAATGSLPAKKTVDGKTPDEWCKANADKQSEQCGTFEFTLTGKNSAPMPSGTADGSGTITKSNNGDGIISFGTITFEAVGDYEYEVKEIAKSGDDTVTYDTTVYTAVAHVTDDIRNGTFTVTWEVDGKVIADNPIVFNNATPDTKPEPTEAVIKVHKNLQDLLDEGIGILPGQYHFNMVKIGADEAGAFDPTEFKVYKDKPNDDEYSPEYVDLLSRPFTQTTTNGASTDRVNAEASFQPIKYTEAGTYYYVIYEDGSKNPVADVVYDKDIALVTVTVTENADHKLSAEVTYLNDVAPKGTSAARFNNRYFLPYTDFSIPITKHLVDASGQRQKLQGGEYQFRITPQDNAPMPDRAKDTDGLVTNDSDGRVESGNIQFLRAGKYWYKVEEVPGTDAGISYDRTVYWVMFDITDDAESLEPYIYKGDANGPYQTEEVSDNEAMFINTEKKPGSVSASIQPLVHKTLRDQNGAEKLFEGEFTFELWDQDPTTAGSDAKPIATTSTDADGWAKFGELTYTASDDAAEESTTHQYWIREIDDHKKNPYIIYDHHVTKLTATVTKTGMGSDSTLTATAVYDNSTLFETLGAYANNATEEKPNMTTHAEFVNIDPVDARLTGLKVMVGPAGKESEPEAGQFRFKVEGKATDDQGKAIMRLPMFSGVGKNGVVANGEHGVIDFGSLEFKATGTYVYTIRELTPEDGETAIAGVTYDKRVYTVTYRVTRDGKLNVAATVTVDGKTVQDVMFRNRTETDKPPEEENPPKTSRPRTPPPTITRLAQTGMAVTSIGIIGLTMLAAGVTTLTARRTRKR